MTATYESIMDAALQLNPGERCRIATSLWESVGPAMPDLDADELESVLNRREAELEQDPTQEISHEAFIAHFSERRQA